MLVVTDLSVSPWPNERAVITIGAYDGVHRGHRAVIAQVQARAAELGARSVVVTFDRHPASVIRPDAAPRLLTNPAQKLELLADTGVDATVVVPFSPEQARETPVDFVERVIVNALRTQAVIVGSDFHFGHMRQGNITLLREMGERHDFTCEPVVLVSRADGVDEPISSTAIRRALAGGEIETATRLLGRALEVRGTVVTGDQRGRTIGFPTANTEVSNQMCLPADGVYAGMFTCADGSVHGCAINLGRRPTFFEHADVSLLEAHLLDFSGDLYGQQVSVTFEHFLRSERKFDGLDAIKAQLQLDVSAARGLVGRK